MPVSYCSLHLKDETWLKIQVIAICKAWQKYLFLSLPFIKCIRHDNSLWHLEVVVSRYSDLEAVLSLKLVQNIKGPQTDKKSHHTSWKHILLLSHMRMVGSRRNVFKGKKQTNKHQLWSIWCVWTCQEVIYISGRQCGDELVNES